MKITPLGIVVILLAFFACCQLASASEWTAQVPVAEGQIDVWLTKTVGRINIGPAFTWVDQDEHPDGDGLGAGVVATYDVLKDDAMISALGLEIPVQWFVGGKAELMWFDKSHNLDPAPSLLTGFRLGSDKAGFSVIYEYALTDELWDKFAARDDRHVLSFAPYYRF